MLAKTQARLFKPAVLWLLLLACSSTLRAQADDPTNSGQENAPAMAMGAGRMVRGTVTAVTADKLTLKTEAGESFQVALTPNTRVMRDRQAVKSGEIKVGDGVGAGGELDASTKTVHALFVSAVSAEEVRKMKDSFGKTWISGKVTAIDELKITVLRSDKVSQVIAVDEDTSFKRGGRRMAMAMQGDASVPMGGGGWRSGNGGGGNGGGGNGGGGRAQPPDAAESITLADVKVGDIVAGQGAMKNGVFVPTTLAVSEPAQQQHRRHQPGDGNPSTTSPAAAAKPE